MGKGRFDLSLLNEPRARLGYARSHLAVVRDEEVLLEHRLNAAELKTRIAEAASKAKLDIIVNFEHVRHATPQALATLMDGEFFAKAAPSVRVRYRMIQGAFASSLEGMSFHGLDLLAEDLQDA